MTLTLLCSETFPEAWWQEAMPGVHVSEVDPTAKERVEKSTEAFKALRDVLYGLDPKVSEVSSKTLKVAAGLQGLPSVTYSRLLARLKVKGWTKQQQRFVRNPFADDATDA
jgi:hypothetical protein